MNIFITGGFGYLGQRIGEYFHSSGAKIYVGSRTKRNKPLWLINGECIHTNWDDIYSSIKNIQNIDLVIHSAGMNSTDSFNNPEMAINFQGMTTKKLIDACIKRDINKFIFLSTAHVYSSPLKGTISEDSVLKNSHPYASSNAIGEKHVVEADISGKINSKVLRISNCFGPPLDINTNCWHLIVNDICLQLIKNNSIKLLSDGTQLRDFIPISEFCRALDFIIKNCMNDRSQNIFNIGGKTFSINDITDIVVKTYKKKYKKSIKLVKSEPSIKKEIEPLVYQMNWTKKHNFKKIFNPYSEIEKLLDFCYKNKEFL